MVSASNSKLCVSDKTRNRVETVFEIGAGMTRNNERNSRKLGELWKISRTSESTMSTGTDDQCDEWKVELGRRTHSF